MLINKRPTLKHAIGRSRRGPFAVAYPFRLTLKHLLHFWRNTLYQLKTGDQGYYAGSGLT